MFRTYYVVKMESELELIICEVFYAVILSNV